MQLTFPFEHFAVMGLAGKQLQARLYSFPLGFELAAAHRGLHDVVIDFDVCTHNVYIARI